MTYLSSTTQASINERLVYLVDDDDDDAFLFEKAFVEAIPHCKVRIFPNGLVMLEIMTEPDNHPHLIFLDLNMPYPDGLEVLMNLKINKQWAHIPVIILSGTQDPRKARLAYQMGAQTVIQKPDQYAQWVELVQVIRQYWFKLASIPQGEA